MDFNTYSNEYYSRRLVKLGLIALIPIVYVIVGAITWSSCSDAYHRIIFANTFVLIWSIIALVKRHSPFCYFMIQLQLLTVMWAIQCMNNNDGKDAIDPHENVYLMISYIFFTLALFVNTFIMGLLILIYGSLYLYYLANPHLIRRPVLGLNDEEIENLPIRRFDSQEMTDPTSPRFFKECVICLENFKQGEEVTELPSCTHSFHKGCIVEWVKKQPHCPYCRNNIRESLTNSPTTVAASPYYAEVENPANSNEQNDNQYRISLSDTISRHHSSFASQQQPAYSELQEV